MLTEEDFSLLTAFRNLTPEQKTASLNFLRATFGSTLKPQDNASDTQEIEPLTVR